MDPPLGIRNIRERSALEVEWTDGAAFHIPYHILRAECGCLMCETSRTRSTTIAVETLSETLEPGRIGFAGTKALRIEWSDGHLSSYEWEPLRTICEEPLSIRLR